MRAFAILGAVLTLVACEPMGPIAGGKLSGTVAAPPEDWSFTTDVQNMHLETTPDDPYSVTVWGVEVGANIYVASGNGGETRWAQRITDDPRVRLKIGNRLFELHASRVTDPAELSAVLTRYVNKYAMDPGEDFARGAWVFRLDRP